MDDIYFSDNKKKNDQIKNNQRKPSQDKFIDTDYYDESFELNFKTKGNAQSFSSKNEQKKGFQLNIPENELGNANSSQQLDRTPKGRMVSELERTQGPAPYQSPLAANNDVDMYGNRKSDYDVKRPGNINNGQPVSRVPRGNRVGTPAQQRNLQRAAVPERNNTNTGKKQSGKSSKRKSSTGLKVFAGFLCLILILVAAIGAFCFSALNSLNYDSSIVPNQYISESELYSSPSVKNILFVGSDARGDVDGQRSDTMILFSIDSKNGQIKLTSFLRDSYVYIPSKGYKTKLNSAFSYGGTQLVIDTIEYNFGIDIDNYVMVSFDAFQQLIDLMGGVTIEGVTENEARYMNNVVDIKSVKPGKNKMNGFTALWYCRIRKLDSDFYRTQRQRKVISAVVNQAKKTNPFTLASICKQVLPNISTDINKSELASLAVGAVVSFLRYDIVQQQIPADGTWSSQRINGSDVIAMNIDENKQILKNFLSTKYVETKEEDK